MIRRYALGRLVLEGMASLEQTHRRNNRKKPCQLGDLGNIALSVQNGFFGIKTTGEQVERHIPCALPQLLSILNGGQRMVVGNKEKGLPLVLQRNSWLHHTEIVPDM